MENTDLQQHIDSKSLLAQHYSLKALYAGVGSFFAYLLVLDATGAEAMANAIKTIGMGYALTTMVYALFLNIGGLILSMQK